MGLTRGTASPCCFYRAEDDLRCVVHGDDFVFEGDASRLREVADKLSKHWIVKVRATLGSDASGDKEVSVLNRIIRWESQCALYEADPRHLEKLLKEMEMSDCRPDSSPGVKVPGEIGGGHVPSAGTPGSG